MGLGLFLARRMIERLGGSLMIESQLGVGTSVTVRLPAESLARPTARPGLEHALADRSSALACDGPRVA